MMFRVGKQYTIDEIHQSLGGEKESYLPQKNGKIVCGRFTLDSNPQAPYIVLVGKGSKIVKKAELLSKQEGFIPVFLKQNTNEWEYIGNFNLRAYSTDSKEIESIKKNVSTRDDVTGILYLGSVGRG